MSTFVGALREDDAENVDFHGRFRGRLRVHNHEHSRGSVRGSNFTFACSVLLSISESTFGSTLGSTFRDSPVPDSLGIGACAMTKKIDYKNVRSQYLIVMAFPEKSSVFGRFSSLPPRPPPPPPSKTKILFLLRARHVIEKTTRKERAKFLTLTPSRGRRPLQHQEPFIT